MNEKDIKKLITLVEESDIESLEVSRWGRKIKITRRLNPESNGHGQMAALAQPSIATPLAPAAVPAPQVQTSVEPAAETADIKSNLVEIKSPMVGTFYAAPAPDADLYISLNEKITAGQVVCIVEAMKLMNEIEAEISGRVVEILVENAQPVEFGQVLFRIDPAG